MSYRLGTLTGNDFVNTSELKAFHDRIASSLPPIKQERSDLTIVQEYLTRECNEGRLRSDNISQWVQSQSSLSGKTKKGILQSLEQYSPKDRWLLIREKGGDFCVNTIKQWESLQTKFGVTTEKVLMQIICDHSVYESPCAELGMPVSAWEITEKLRHNLYDMVLAPIRDTKPAVIEVSVSPLRSGSTPNRKPFEYTPDFSFVDGHKLQWTPNQPIILFVFIVLFVV